MKEKETWICKKCKSTDFYTKPKGPHMGVYCCKCNTWLKWMKGGSGLHAKQTINDELKLSPVKAIIETQLLKDDIKQAKDEAPWL